MFGRRPSTRISDGEDSEIEGCRIIAAASSSPKDLEAKGAVSADGIPEIPNQNTQTVTSEAAAVQEDKKEDSPSVGEQLKRLIICVGMHGSRRPSASDPLHFLASCTRSTELYILVT